MSASMIKDKSIVPVAMEISLCVFCVVVAIPSVILWIFYKHFGYHSSGYITREKRYPPKKVQTFDAEKDSCFLPPGEDELIPIDIDKFRKELLLGHNHYRHLHGSSPLSILKELNDAAQHWAENIANKGYVQYAEYLLSTGESIAKMDLSKESLNGKLLSMYWYKEIKNYSFSEPRWRRGAYHFSQMIWQNTTHLGAGLCRVPGTSKVYVVVRYFPAGNSNMPGEFHRNVSPRITLPTGSRSSWCMEDDVIVRNSVSGRLNRRSYVSSVVADEAFV